NTLQAVPPVLPIVGADPLAPPNGPGHPADRLTYLRFDPVLHPVIVPRHAYTEGESLECLVIRSNGSSATHESARDCAKRLNGLIAARVGGAEIYRASTERHVVPPKTSLGMAELHGLFDSAIGASDPTTISGAYTLGSREIGRLSDKAGTTSNVEFVQTGKSA